MGVVLTARELLAKLVRKADIVRLKLLRGVRGGVREQHRGEGLARRGVRLVVDTGDLGAEACERKWKSCASGKEVVVRAV